MKKIFRFRPWIQAAWTALSNGYIAGFLHNKIYTGPFKQICVPGLNCYSCPGALGSCPIGSMQAVISGNKHNFSWYVLGLLMLFGAVLGRLICGFLCPFGWIQELLHKLPVKKLHVPEIPDKWLRKLKYVILAVFVILLPMLAVDIYGLGSPWFCKWICPAGTLEGGLPIIAANESLRNSIGFTFWWKVALLAVTVLASMVIYRPFCKYICPLGAFYALFNRFSLMRMELDSGSCIRCNKCMRACPMQVNVLKNINSAECIRCGKCARECPTGAIDLKFGRITVQKNEI